MTRKVFGRLTSARSFVVAALALAMSTLTASAAITVNTANCTLPDGQVGEMYDADFYFGADNPNNAFDGVSADWDVGLKEGAVVPEGLGEFYVFKEDVDKANLWSVAPVAEGTYEVWVTVTDGAESQDLKLTVTITDTPHLSVVDGGLLKSAYQGDDYSVALADTITGGSGNYSFVLTSGSLPTGLTLTDGVISGTLNAVPNYEGYAFDVTVTDLDENSTLDPIVATYYIFSKALSPQYYIDSNGSFQFVNCIELDADRTTLSSTGLSSGWYVVPPGSLSATNTIYMNRAITVSGEVHLILSDYSSMTITSAKAGLGNVAINVAQGEGNALNIYGQSGRSGKLTVTGGRRAVGISGTVRIYGGTVDAKSSGSGIAGIDGTLVIGANMMANANNSVITQIDPTTALSRNETTGEVALDGSRYYYVSYAVATTVSDIIYMDGETRLTDLEPATYVEGTGVSTLPTPVKAGYTFSHWSTAAGSGGTVVHGISDSATGDQTIYAKWEAIKYTITYMNGVSVIEGLFPSNYFASATYSLPSRLSDLPTGARFDGWYEDSAFSGAKVTEISENSTTGDKTFYAKIFYPISYYDGDTPIANLELASYVVSSEDLPLPDPTAPSGKTFAGWYTDAELTDGPVAVIIAGSTGAKTFYAKWDDAIEPKISVSFIDADGNPANEYCQIINKPITTLNDGWYAVNGEVDYGDSSIKVVGDVHLILFDDARLSVTNVSSRAAIEVTSGNSLSIYAQSRGTGAIEAKGGSESAGIGGGLKESCGTVSIYGGTVTAIGSTFGAGIGGGWEGNGGEITIKGGSVTAYSSGAGAGIGGGYEAESQGSLTVAAGIGVCSKAVAETYADVPVNDETYAVTLDGKKSYVVAPISGIVYMDGESAIGGLEPDSYVEGVGATLAASATRVTPGYAFAGWYEQYGSSPVTTVPASATGTQTFYAQWEPIEYTVTYKKGALALSGYHPSTYTVESSAIQRMLPSTAPADPGKVFEGWCSDAGLTSDLVSSIPADSIGNLTYYAKFRNITSDSIPVDFVAADGSPMNETCQVLVRGMRYLDAEWYVVTNNLTLTDPLVVEGNVNLVLMDGVTNSVYSLVNNTSAITIKSGCSLAIWGQSEGTGVLDAYANLSQRYGCGIGGEHRGTGINITINGGTVKATGNERAAGIGSDDNASGITVTINGGTVTATGGSLGAGIGGGSTCNGATVIINGGTVTATGGLDDSNSFGAGIGGGAVASNQGTLTVAANMEVKAGATSNPTTELTPDSEGRVTLGGERFYVITEKAVVEDWPADTSTVVGQTAADAFGVTGDLAGVDAKELADWAKANSVDFGNKEAIIADAFLLNCANTAEAVAAATSAAKEAIKITKIEIVDGVPKLTCPENYGNGQVVIKGSVNIGASAEWHDKTTGDKFFKTVLEFK